MRRAVLALMIVSLNYSASVSTAGEPPTAAATAPTQGNPLLAPFATPFGVPPFAEIATEHFKPAIEEGMKRQQEAIDAITAETAAPTLANTVEALEYSSEMLDRVRGVFFNLTAANTDEALQAVERDVTPLLTQHNDNILLNAKLFARIKAIHDQRDSLALSPEQRRLVEETYLNFARNGVALPPEKQDVLRKLNERISLLEVQFSNNLLAETKAFTLLIDDKARLSGLPSSVVAEAAEAAQKAGHPGKWLFTADKSVLIPVLTFADNRDLREKLFAAYVVRGDQNNEHDNKAIAAELVALRIKRAKLLGYRHHADYVLERRMAKTPERVEELMTRVWRPAIEQAKREAADLQALVTRQGGTFALQPWDWWYYAEKLRKEKYDLSESELKPYFELEAVRNGAFDVIGRLFGITFTPRPDLPKYHPEVQVYEVKNADGSHRGILTMDFHPRPGKRPGAWMNDYRDQCRRNGTGVTPIIATVFNFPRATADEPSLLSLEDVETVFHELGHAIHGLLSDVTYPSLSGTKVPRDFVEMPSQVLECWATHPDVMPLYARHHKTGNAMPAELIAKIQKASTFNQGFTTVEFLSAARLDMAVHSLTDENAPIDVAQLERNELDRIGMIPEIVVRYRIPYFLHIFTHGYEAGYYSYLWSEVIDADAFEAFKAKGIFDRATADALRREVLQRGNTRDAMEMYKAFRGHEPTIEPLLKRRGLTSN